MTAAELEELTTAITKMYLGSKHRDPSEAEMGSYIEMLEDLPWEHVRVGFMKARRAARPGFMPNDADIRNAALAEADRAASHIEMERVNQTLLPVTPWTDEQKAEARALLDELNRKLSAQEQLDPDRVKEWSKRQ